MKVASKDRAVKKTPRVEDDQALCACGHLRSEHGSALPAACKHGLTIPVEEFIRRAADPTLTDDPRYGCHCIGFVPGDFGREEEELRAMERTIYFARCDERWWTEQGGPPDGVEADGAKRARAVIDWAEGRITEIVNNPARCDALVGRTDKICNQPLVPRRGNGTRCAEHDLDRMIQITFADGTTELRSGWHPTYHDAPSCPSVSLRWRMGGPADVARDPTALGHRRERVTVYVESEAERETRERSAAKPAEEPRGAFAIGEDGRKVPISAEAALDQLAGRPSDSARRAEENAARDAAEGIRELLNFQPTSARRR